MSLFFAKASAGVFHFEPLENQKEITIEIIDDNIPETEMNFFIIMQNPIGGVKLNNRSKKIEIIIQKSDNPYGNLEFLHKNININESEKTFNIYVSTIVISLY